MSRMLIVDGMSVLKTTAGGAAFLTNGFAYNFFTQLTATIRKFGNIRGVIVCWEGGHEHRTKIFAEYKAHRAKASTPEIREQRVLVQNLLELLGVDQVHSVGHEADDVAAYLVRNLNAPMVLYSNDSDWLQLVRDQVSIYQKAPTGKGRENQRVEITIGNFYEKVGFPTPAEYLKAKCIFGDDVDLGKGSGLFGVGPETVKAWISGSTIQDGKRQKIEEFLASDRYARNRLLIDLITPRELQLSWRKSLISEERAREFLTEIKWPSILAKFPAWWETYSGAAL